MFKEQDPDGKVTATPQRSIAEPSQLDRFQVDLQGSLASRLFTASSPASERTDIQAIVSTWTDNWARMGGQTAAQAMTA